MKTTLEISVRGGEETVIAEHTMVDGQLEIVEITDTHGKEYEVSDFNYAIILEACNEGAYLSTCE